MGGEKKKSRRCCTSIGGSPPHGRGKEESVLVLLLGLGIIPAWAGKSQSCAATMERWWDHPRVGGEKLVIRVISKPGVRITPA